MKISWFLFFLLILSVSAIAQNKNLKGVETVTIDGKKYLLHTVQQGETIFSIGKKYSIEQKELVGANPQLIFGLKTNDQLKIPYNSVSQESGGNKVIENVSAEKFIYHVVKKSETIYSIANEYSVSIRDIYRFNPESEKEVLENEIIRIPEFEVNTTQSGLIREDDEFYYHKIQEQENLYSVSRLYDTQVADIIKYNPDLTNRFEFGAIIKVPKFKGESPQLNVMETGEYFYYTVESGDTFYSFQRRFGVSPKTLIEINPVLNDGLQAGLKIKIPSTEIPKIEVVPLQPNLFIKHIVKPGETLYGISKQFDSKVMDIKELNPELKSRELIAGETILIAKNESLGGTKNTYSALIQEVENVETKVLPVKTTPEVIFKYEEEKQPECEKSYSVEKGDTFRVAMFLPFYYDKNDSLNSDKISERERLVLDSLKRIDPKVLAEHFRIVMNKTTRRQDTILVDSLKVKDIRSLYKYSRAAVSFYQGVLLALDSMQKTGAKIRLDLYDTENNIRKINRILSNPDFINTDMIVGPIDTILQKGVSEFSAKNRIPLVSPFTMCETLLNKNPYYFQVSPSKQYMLRKTAEYITDEFYDNNFVVMTTGNFTAQPEFELVKMVREKFFSKRILNSNNDVLFNLVDFSGTEGYWQVKRILRKDIENVIFIPTSDEAMLSRAINSLNVLADEYPITLIGIIDYPNFKSIKTEYFHKLKLHFLTPNYIDYNRPEVNTFIRQFRADFYTEPDMLAYRGFDIMTYFIGAYESFGKNFSECVGSYENRSVQSDFNFQKVQQFGGYMNHSLYIINYTTDYQINVISEVTEGRMLHN